MTNWLLASCDILCTDCRKPYLEESPIHSFSLLCSYHCSFFSQQIVFTVPFIKTDNILMLQLCFPEFSCVTVVRYAYHFGMELVKLKIESDLF